ncbi:MAG TPA: hypothetical protein VFP14_10260 [Novosphingobium sp.]|nr:hypothetical protein [Novosphingobium sp.]
MTHRLNLFLVALAIVIGIPYYWLLLENPSAKVAPFPVKLEDLRRLGDSLPGARPQSVTMTVVAWDRTPGTLLAAGSGVKRRLYSVQSFRLDYADRPPVVIGTGTTGALATFRRIETFLDQHQRLVDADMRTASVIIALDESPESLGGLAEFANFGDTAVPLTRAQLNPAQLPSASRAAGLPWPPKLVLGAAITGNQPRPVAPGVVIIPTGAPTSGSEMVYVRLASGREYLFAGAVAPYAINFIDLRTSSRLLNLLEQPQDRHRTMRWLVTLQEWLQEDPGLYVVPGNDVMAVIDKDSPSGFGLRDVAAPQDNAAP